MRAYSCNTNKIGGREKERKKTTNFHTRRPIFSLPPLLNVKLRPIIINQFFNFTNLKLSSSINFPLFSPIRPTPPTQAKTQISPPIRPTILEFSGHPQANTIAKRNPLKINSILIYRPSSRRSLPSPLSQARTPLFERDQRKQRLLVDKKKAREKT